MLLAKDMFGPFGHHTPPPQISFEYASSSEHLLEAAYITISYLTCFFFVIVCTTVLAKTSV